ncbi:MAG: peptidyl-prolyl cis-trans isomerase [Myxococcota bacterium]
MRVGTFLRAPLLHFGLVGALLFAGSAWLRERDAPGCRFPPVHHDNGRVEAIRAEATARNGRPPTALELMRLVALDLDEEHLVREALARGLDEGDPGVEARLVEKMLFLDDGASPADAPALVAQARSLGLDRDDVVIRRLLAEKLRLVATTLEPHERPDEAALRYAYHVGAERLRAPARLRFVHVFLSRDRRGSAAPSDSVALRRRIEAEGIPPTDAIALGDAFPGGHVFADRTADEVARQLGRDFAERLPGLPVGAWSEPIESAYGLHLVRVEAIEPGELPAFERVRERLRLEVEAERRDDKLAALNVELRNRYGVVSAGSGEERE